MRITGKNACTVQQQPGKAKTNLRNQDTEYSSIASGISRQHPPNKKLSVDDIDFTTSDEETCKLRNANDEVPSSNKNSLNLLEGRNFSIENYCSLLENFDPKNDSLEKLEYLLNDLNKVKNLPGGNPVEILSLILNIDSPLIAKYLEKHPDLMAEISYTDQVEILSYVALNGHVDTFNYLVNVCKLNIYAGFGYYRTVLDAICRTKDDRMKLLFSKFNINQRGDNGFVPLHYVAQSNYISAAKELLSRPEIDPNIEDDDGRTAIYYAVANNNISILEALLSHPKCIIKTNGRKNILDVVKNYCIDPKCIDLLCHYIDPNCVELLKQQAPWLENLRNDKLQSIKDDIRKDKFPTENIQKFISEILYHRQLKNRDILFSLQEIKSLRPYDSFNNKLLKVIKFKYYFDKYFDAEDNNTHNDIEIGLKKIFYKCIEEGDFQSIHGLENLGFTSKNFRTDSNPAYNPRHKKLEEDLVAGKIPRKKEILDAVLKSRFFNKFKLHQLYYLTIARDQQELAKLCHYKYGASVALIDVDNKYPTIWGISHAAFEKPERQDLDKAVKKVKELQWDPEFIDDIEKRGRISLETNETINGKIIKPSE